ncbi:flagellar hook capping FlgD N-terminal domain-containing protein [Lebetimonas sp. JH292]|uniref:flagellar hook capping FlgD N-terminal domain-containing protein n=1 Tax=Lebetimonas sp. JH292 TaxID=990068 RepID=UPI000463FE0D|nr:flagellar hook capping FlgD N-terminal domain-containing protein [Lebetimonas sp. JH292]
MSSIATINNNATQAGNDKVYNPNSQLDKNAFMKLFLKQLEMQDPTNPMDTDKMLEQTAYLSTMEMNTNMQKTINTLAQTLTATNQLSTLSSIGKMADTGERYINVTDNDTKKDFELYFGDNIQSGKVQIKDKAGNIVKKFHLNPHSKGILSFEWDLKDNNANRVKSDSYEVSATYTDPNGKQETTALGAYPIESIRFENGTVYAKLGKKYIPFYLIKEIYQWQG